ncbi:MAG: signal peptidase II [Desulfobacterota bacterium]|nr:signal peptidase II [Thermodesulfobacteriota bacterium]
MNMNNQKKYKKNNLPGKLFLLLIVSFLVIGLDQGSKLWIERNISTEQPLILFPNFLQITFIKNPGGAFGIFSDFGGDHFRFFFILFNLITLGLIGFFYFKLPSHLYSAALGMALIIGGAIGNFIDRLRLGEVIDFIDLHYYSYHWPAFNVADSAITVGAVLLGILILLKKW